MEYFTYSELYKLNKIITDRLKVIESHEFFSFVNKKLLECQIENRDKIYSIFANTMITEHRTLDDLSVKISQILNETPKEKVVIKLN